MDITRRLLGNSAIADPATRKIEGFDVSTFIRRLILFDTYILRSVRLQEFPYILKAFGFEGTMDLLRSSALEIQCNAIGVGQTGQLGVLESRAKKGLLPPLSYCLSGIMVADQRKLIHDCLRPLHGLPGLHHKQVIKLKAAISNKLVSLPPEFPLLTSTQTTSTVLSKPDVVKRSVQMAAKRTLNLDITDFQITVHAIDAEDIRVETDLGARLHTDVDTTHKVVERGLLAVGGMAQRFLEMRVHNALNGFMDDDLPLVHEHLDFLARAISPKRKEEHFSRVMRIAGFPDVAAFDNACIDVGRLLEVRDSSECREFREWLPTIASASDKEIAERLASLRGRLGDLIHSNAVKAARFVVTTGIGLMNPAAGIAAGVLDTFVIEKLLPRTGPLAFVSRLYPSIFKSKQE